MPSAGRRLETCRRSSARRSLRRFATPRPAPEAGGLIWVEPDPAPVRESHLRARAASAHVATNAVPGAKAAQVERTDRETEFGEMRAEIAGAVTPRAFSK